MRFKDLAIGDEFHFNRNLESGLLADLSLPGRILYRKVSVRKWHCDKYGEGRIGSISARVFPAY